MKLEIHAFTMLQHFESVMWQAHFKNSNRLTKLQFLCLGFNQSYLNQFCFLNLACWCMLKKHVTLLLLPKITLLRLIIFSFCTF